MYIREYVRKDILPVNEHITNVSPPLSNIQNRSEKAALEQHLTILLGLIKLALLSEAAKKFVLCHKGGGRW